MNKAAAAICRRALGSSAMSKSCGSASEGTRLAYYAFCNNQRVGGHRPLHNNLRMMTTSITDDENTPPPKSSNLERSGCPSSMGHTPLLTPAGCLLEYDSVVSPNTDDIIENELDDCLLPKDDDNLTELVKPPESDFFFIPQVKLHDGDGSQRKRVLVLCTGGTLTMAPNEGGALSPVPGALTDFMKQMLELTNDKMPDVVVHEYSPLLDSSDMGPPDWQVLARDIKANYLHFDGFVILMGTDTMAYTATALSFMLENLGKPVVFTGSQVPIGEFSCLVSILCCIPQISHILWSISVFGVSFCWGAQPNLTVMHVKISSWH